MHRPTDPTPPAPELSPLDALTKSLGDIAKTQHQEHVQALHKAASQPGLSAHEVARREVMRNRADQRGAA